MNWSKRTRRTKQAAAAGCAATLVAVFACDPPIAGPRNGLAWIDDGSSVLAHQIIEDLILSQTCDLWVDEADAFPGLQIYVNALTGGPVFENEIHDCQRLVIQDAPGSLRYGPMLGIFPLDAAMAVDQFPSAPVAVATIFSWKVDGRIRGYGQLGIESSDPWSCLWVNLADSTATIVTLPDQSTGCQYGAGSPPSAGEFDLSVTPVPADSVPPTARWRWDASGEHYIGIRCGDGEWCSVSRQGLTVSEAVDPESRESVGRMDEQHLAVDDGTGLLVPGPLMVIRPLLPIADSTDWSPVASIELRDASGLTAREIAAYRNKFSLANVGPDRYESTLQLILIADTARFVSTAGERGWRMQRAVKEPHGAMGSVRWRWRETDETTWISCDEGCCRIVGDDEL